MKHILQKTLLVFAATGLVGCSSVPAGFTDFGAMKNGTQVSNDQMSHLVDNKSKQADVVALIGQPNRKTQLNSREVWYYDFSRIGMIESNLNETTAFEFNGKGTLVSHYKTNGSTSANALLKASGAQSQ